MAGFVCIPSTDKRQGENQRKRKLIYRTLGKTGIRIPVIGMGILASGSPALMQAALAASTPNDGREDIVITPNIPAIKYYKLVVFDTSNQKIQDSRTVNIKLR